MFSKDKKNKKGQMTIVLILLPLGLLIATILILTGGIFTVKMNDALRQDIDIGQVNLRNISDDTIGKFNTMYLNNADWWGISTIFGMILGLFISAYMTRNSAPKWGIIFDIFIIVGMFIFCLYISSTYSSMLDALSGAGEDFLEVYAPKTSMFMLNLHIFSAIIGVITMVIFHSSIPRKSEERIQEGGFLQGVQ